LDSTNLSRILRERRQNLEITQLELADLAEVSERLIRDLERGRLTVRTDKLLAVLAALGLEMKVSRTHAVNK
jgi:HTH-type transcriptional regulator/antitoxin HipB